MAAAGYVLIAAVMFFMQRNLLYVPGSKTFEYRQCVGLAGFEPVTLSTKDDVQLKGWYSPPPHNPAPVFLYCMAMPVRWPTGPSGSSCFAKKGFGVLAISWRGFGGSGGSPTEEGLLEDGRTALKHLQAEGIGLERVVMFGESLGSGRGGAAGGAG
jgi:dipeptidyl aminopeptidase/acylaminoacyl peptidase